jgi:U6 snRNA-associated Sm-like protein LSm2
MEPRILEERMKFTKVEREQDVLNQLNTSTWAIDALKFLNGGRLIPSPAAKRLSKATTPLGSAESSGKRRIRVLDLGGHPSCDWAWRVASEYPNVKIYTLVTKQQVRNPGLKGPPNHRQVSVPHLWKFPFPDNQFDVISSRSLHATLKSERPIGEDKDEYDLCLKECYRCLKPGGFLEFLVMDSEIARAGPYGSATSVEFGFNLKTRGYDPAPTKPFLSRLRKANFVGMKRAWLFLPMGAASSESQLPCGSPCENNETLGSTADVAGTTGLLGGWMWEQWMLKLQIEMGRDKEKLLEEMASVFDEGRKSGAGWRCLNGWAMKPKTKARGVLPPSTVTCQPNK